MHRASGLVNLTGRRFLSTESAFHICDFSKTREQNETIFLQVDLPILPRRHRPSRRAFRAASPAALPGCDQNAGAGVCLSRRRQSDHHRSAGAASSAFSLPLVYLGLTKLLCDFPNKQTQ